MAAGAFTFYDSFAEIIAEGDFDPLAVAQNTYKVALFTSSYTPSVSTDQEYTFLSGEVANGNGYTTGGNSLTSVTYTATGGVGTFDAADVVWTASGGSITARYAVLYIDSVTSGTYDLIGYFVLDNTPADVTATDGNTLTIQWNASGILTVTA